jgi:signal transduction histidine kinase
MDSQTASLFSLALIGSTLLTAALASWSMYYRIRGSYAFTLLMLALGWWSCAYAQELSSPNLATAVLWGKSQYLAIVAIPPLWLLFGLRYAGHRPHPHPWNRLALAVVPAITLLLVWTTEQHGLIWAQVERGTLGSFHPLVVDYGPWFWVHTIYSYNLIAAGSVLLLGAAWRAAPNYRRQAIGLVSGAVVPVAGNVCYLAGVTPFGGLDLTPLLFTCSGVLFSWASYSSRLMTIGPVARNQLMEAMADVVLVLDDQGRIADMNPAAQRLVGGPRAFGQRLAMVAPDLAEQLAARAPELGVETGDGPRTYDVQHKPLPGWHGASAGSLIVLRDITPRKDAERELRAQKELFAALVVLADAANARPTLRETLQNVLKAACELTGAEQGSIFLFSEGFEVQSIVIHGLSHTAFDRQRVKRVLAEGLAGWVVRSRQLAVVDDTAADARWLHLESEPRPFGSALAVPVSEGGQILGVLTLYHAQAAFFRPEQAELMSAAAAQIGLAVRNAQMYEAQRQLAQEAEAASRAKSTFLATISHELRTPLNVIIGYGDLLSEEFRGREGQGFSRELRQISDAGRQLLTLVNDVIELSRVEAGQAELDLGPIDVVALAYNVGALTRPLAAQNGNTLTVDCPEDLGVIVSDLGKLRQILLHLLSNACKFTERGAIQLTVRRGPAPLADEDTVTEVISFAVSDTGIGITEEQHERIFLNFTQGDESSTRRYGGVGLGLALSQQLARMLGAEISVRSAPGQGATFTISLPVARDESLQLTQKAHSAHP